MDFSPLMLIGYFILFLLALQGYDAYLRKYRFANNKAIERITGVAFPKVDIIDYEKDNRGFLGDYKDKLTLKMEDELNESTYHYLDSISMQVIQNGSSMVMNTATALCGEMVFLHLKERVKKMMECSHYLSKKAVKL